MAHKQRATDKTNFLVPSNVMHIQKRKFFKSQKRASSLCPPKNVNGKRESVSRGEKTEGHAAFNQGEEPIGNCILFFLLRDGKLSVLRVPQMAQPNIFLRTQLLIQTLIPLCIAAIAKEHQAYLLQLLTKWCASYTIGFVLL